MTYSVWNPARKVYEYFEDSKSDASNPNPRHLTAGILDSVSSTHAGWRLPPDARKTGEGENARGMIATGEVTGGSGWAVPLGFALAGYGLYRLWRK
jgi:hypothetical protein